MKIWKIMIIDRENDSLNSESLQSDTGTTGQWYFFLSVQGIQDGGGGGGGGVRMRTKQQLWTNVPQSTKISPSEYWIFYTMPF